MLHESWKDKSVIESTGDNGFEYGYLQGASDFQAKALEKLQSLINTAPELNISGVYQSELHKAIEIIKNLKV